MTERVLHADQRPVEVTYVPEATFEDIVQMGIGSLATSDATVIGRIIEPGYQEFQEGVASAITSHDIRRPSEVSQFVRSHDLHAKIADTHSRLILQQRQGGGGHTSTTAVTSLLGIPATKGGGNFQAAHTDENITGELRVTMSFTLYHASRLPWRWRLTPDAILHDTRRHRAQPFVDVELTPPGCVILGENSRVNPRNQRPRSVGHQVISPRSAWSGSNVKRVRLLVTN